MAQCALHADVDALGTCDRCGRFACGVCLQPRTTERFCPECAERMELRLAASGRAQLTLVLSLMSLNCLVFLVPIALTLALIERQAIARGEAPEGGRSWINASLALCAVATGLWSLVGCLMLTSSV
ncbi:MAG: hypothetical protein K1X64_13280 [Myxococcaceae bacterium]|nr:hypothetical protein [Myxococcaceae bacterium]